MTATESLTLASPNLPDPREAPAIRWGVLGPGGIAREFATSVATGTASTVTAVGSRSAQRAQTFADEFGIAAACGSYAELVADDDIDAVYVASPHSEHHEHALLALDAGKPVLVEKAFARSLREADEVLGRAAEQGLLVAEAMWSRYLPHYAAIARTIAAGVIGEVAVITADHDQLLYPNSPERLSSPALAGGALLDLGVYPVSFADHVLGAVPGGVGLADPAAITAQGVLTDEGVDASVAMVVSGQPGSSAVCALTTSMVGESSCPAMVVGTRARLEIDGIFYQPAAVRLVAPDGTVADRLDAAYPSGVRGFSYEAAAFARALTDGALETTQMPHAATRRVMAAMDEVRRQIGVTYPGENADLSS